MAVIDLSVAGMAEYRTPKDSFNTPHGPNKTQISWRRTWNGEKELQLVWRIKF